MSRTTRTTRRTRRPAAAAAPATPATPTPDAPAVTPATTDAPATTTPATDAPAVTTTPDAPATPTTTPAAPRFTHAAAVALARHHMHTRNPAYDPATPGDPRRRAAAASNGDHAAVRAWITDAAPGRGRMTVDRIMSAACAPDTPVSDVFRCASFDPAAPPSIMAPVTAGCRPVAWRMGRYAAGIVAAWIVEIHAPAARPATGDDAWTPAA